MTPKAFVKNTGLLIVLSALLIAPIASFALVRVNDLTNTNVLSSSDFRSENSKEASMQEQLKLKLPDNFIVTN